MICHSPTRSLASALSRPALFACGLLVLFATAAMGQGPETQPDRPNVLWLSSEDHGPQMGCYGDPQATTPNVDALAAKGLRYSMCWSNAPVCAPARTTIITGMYPPSLGAEHMRSMVSLPQGVRMFPSILREAGYFCTNNSKEDYNVRETETVWDVSSNKAHYKSRPKGQPFFAVFNATTSHESAIRNFRGEPEHDPATMRIPAYHPDTPTSRRDWAIFYDSVTKSDAIAGKHLAELEKQGLSDTTIVFYWGDHGSGMPRGKRWTGNSGMQVPLVVYIPEKFAHLRPSDYQPGGVSDRLVGFIDFAPTVLSLAGLKAPDTMQGKAFLGLYVAEQSPSYNFGFRSRMDERVDFVRSVTDGRFVYIRNFMPHRSHGQNVAYQHETATTAEWKAMFDRGELNSVQAAYWTSPRATEELYDLKNDPDETVNLAGRSEHEQKLIELRSALKQQMLEIKDLGLIPEGQRFDLAGQQSMYDWAREAGNYDVQAIYEAAEKATSPGSFSTAEIVPMVNDENSVIRYWGVLGLLIRGEAVVSEHSKMLTNSLHDPSNYVAVEAARSLALYGSESDRKTSVERLMELANWDNHDVFTAMSALDALNQLASVNRKFEVAIDSLPTKGKTPHGRYSDYVQRLIESTRNRAF